MEIKNVSYSLVLSHTFPGVLLSLELMLAFQLFTPIDVFGKLMPFANANIYNLISIIAVFFIFATLFGFILDGIHHHIFKKEEDQTNDIYMYIDSIERMHISKSLLDDDLWYPYEAYANIWIAMMPGIILLPYFLYHMNVNWFFIASLEVVYLYVFFIMYKEALSILELYKVVERNLIKAFITSHDRKETQSAKQGETDE